MSDDRPGLNPARLRALMTAAIARCRLDLSGAEVLTEAASGAYVVTPVLAALGGADRVYALARSTRHGSAEEVGGRTLDLARAVGVAERIEIVKRKTRQVVGRVDIVTNAGHVRPIDAEMVSWLKPTAVVALMYEAWEFRPGDVDLAACRRRGIAVAGTNKRHPAVYVVSYLGIMAVKLLLDAGVAIQGDTVLVLSDNTFGPSIARGLTNGGARVDLAASLGEADSKRPYDAIVVALRPRSRPVVAAEAIARRWPGAVIAQFWGDVDRAYSGGVPHPVWPLEPPPRGHMGILPSAVGPEPVVRLQAGGLKVAEVLRRGALASPEDCEFVQELALEAIPG